jgi:hypothetical protein
MVLTGEPEMSKPSFFYCDRSGAVKSVWNVQPCGDYEADCKKGNELAREYIEGLRLGTLSPSVLLNVAKQMPKSHSGIEAGFFHGIAAAAMH